MAGFLAPQVHNRERIESRERPAFSFNLVRRRFAICREIPFWPAARVLSDEAYAALVGRRAILRVLTIRMLGANSIRDTLFRRSVNNLSIPNPADGPTGPLPRNRSWPDVSEQHEDKPASLAFQCDDADIMRNPRR